jgi:hypothetical protein
MQARLASLRYVAIRLRLQMQELALSFIFCDFFPRVPFRLVLPLSLAAISNASNSCVSWQHSGQFLSASIFSCNHESNKTLLNRSISLSETSQRLATTAGESADKYDKGAPRGA